MIPRSSKPGMTFSVHSSRHRRDRVSVLCDQVGVYSTVAGRQRTLCDPVHAIIAIAVILTDTVPMHGSAVVGQGICDGDLKSISPSSPNERSRVLAVDKEADPFTMAVRITRAIRNFQMIRNCFTRCWEFQIEICRDTVTVRPACPCIRSVDTPWVRCRSFDLGWKGGA